MSYAPEYVDRDVFAIDAVQDERVAFIRRTYGHLLAAVLAFTALCGLVLSNEALAQRLTTMLVGHQWWLVLVAFFAASWVARKLAYSGASAGAQYAGLVLYTVAEAVIFTPLLYLTQLHFGGNDVILQAGIVTLFIFAGLTGIVMLTRTDFSFLRNILWLGALAAIVLVGLSFFTPIVLGTWFVVGMVVLMSGFILYDTSNVMHHFRTDQHVAAALELFASLATLFWYVLRLMSILNDD